MTNNELNLKEFEETRILFRDSLQILFDHVQGVLSNPCSHLVKPSDTLTRKLQIVHDCAVALERVTARGSQVQVNLDDIGQYALRVVDYVELGNLYQIAEGVLVLLCKTASYGYIPKRRSHSQRNPGSYDISKYFIEEES
jgi:hypothetical protein